MACGCRLRNRIIKNNLLIDKREVYLDYNATTKPDIDILAEVEKVNRLYWGNPSAQNSRGVQLYNYISDGINNIKMKLKQNNSLIYFDASSSSIAQKLCMASEKHVLTSSIDHNSLLENAEIKLNVDTKGQIILKEISEYPDSTLIYSPVNHETGNLQPIKEIYSLCQKSNIRVIIDAVQTVSRLSLTNWLRFCDGFYFSGHKIHGIQGASILLLKDDFIDFRIKDKPLPFSLFDGTFNTPGVVSILKATDKLLSNHSENIRILEILHNDALVILKKRLSNFFIESEPDCAPGIINLSLPKADDMEELLFKLNRAGIMISRFSACTGDIREKSHILMKMGRDDSRAATSIRISFGKYTKRDDFHRLAEILNSIYPSI